MSSLTSIEQKQIAFQDRQITAVMVQDPTGRENVYIPLRPLVEGMGLNWSAQYRRIKKNPVLSEACQFVAVTTTNPKGGNPNKLCIPISHLNGFLFGINAKRVKPEIREALLEYQEKCYQVLFNAFNGTESMRRFYSAIGHEGGWIDARIQKHITGTVIGDIWLIEGIPIEHHEMLQNELNKGTFGLSTDKHRQLKQLPDDSSLRDNMTRLELLMSMYADEANRLLIENKNPSGLDENKALSSRAGLIAGEARHNLEQKTGGKVLSDKNNLDKQLGDGEGTST